MMREYKKKGQMVEQHLTLCSTLSRTPNWRHWCSRVQSDQGTYTQYHVVLLAYDKDDIRISG